MVELQRPVPGPAAGQLELYPYRVTFPLGNLRVGTDNIHFDVFLSPRFVEQAQRYLLALIRQRSPLQQIYAGRGKQPEAPDLGSFRRALSDLLQTALTRAHYEKNREIDILARLAVLKLLLAEMQEQFAAVTLECKEEMRARGDLYFERTMTAHVLKARLAEFHANRKNLFRELGEQLAETMREIEDKTLAKMRRALFGDEYAEEYDLLHNRLLFVEGGKDDIVMLHHYVLLGNFPQDPDRVALLDRIFQSLLREHVLVTQGGEESREAEEAYQRQLSEIVSYKKGLETLEEERMELGRQLAQRQSLAFRLFSRSSPSELAARLAGVEEQYREMEVALEQRTEELEQAKQRLEYVSEQFENLLGEFLNNPVNARALFGAPTPVAEADVPSARLRRFLFEEMCRSLNHNRLAEHILAAYEIRGFYRDFCPPINPQQLKKALVDGQERARLKSLLEQFPSRRFPTSKIEEAARKVHRNTWAQLEAVALQFAEDFMRFRRDHRNWMTVTAAMEKINLVREERARQMSRMNHCLYEILLGDEQAAGEDKILSHAIVKADIRNSSGVTRELLARGLNPASHFSLNLHEPVKRMLDQFGAAKVFIEGDAIILAIYETEANRTHQRAVGRACTLAQEILAVSQAYNARAEGNNLPSFELGLGVAFQNSSPTFWMDGDTRIMISRAINLSDRLSSCSRAARRLLSGNRSPFRLFLLQTLLDDPADEGEEVFLRYNVNGVELNEEGFEKLREEMSLRTVSARFLMPWGEDTVRMHFGDLPFGESFRKLLVREDRVRRLTPEGQIDPQPLSRRYFEICTDPELLRLIESKIPA